MGSSRSPFRLAGVLRARKLQERACERAVAAARAQLHAARARRRACEQRLEHALEAAAGRRTGRLEVARVLRELDELATCRQAIAEACAAEAEAEAALAEAEAAWRERVQQRRVLEVLERAAYEQHERQRRRREQQAMDEAALVRFEGREP
ncbi:MAG: hypothetical protein D6776_04845 [Planctomycetota bacterium]|nr:MAG: hypothetical protein D6776_04845 [Planctomycetota bacterium]